LYGATNGKEALFGVDGIGIWGKADTDILARMLDPACSIGHTPHTLSWTDTCAHNNANSAKLHNLADSVSDISPGTTRVIRIYEQTGDRFTLTQRIDWELRLTKQDHRKIGDGLRAALDGSSLRDITAILIKDLRKGVITPALIRSLAEHCPAAFWYISSKEWKPSWATDIPQDKVRLFLIPDLAANMAVHVGDVALWTTVGGYPSERAMYEMDALASRYPRALVLALPSGISVVVRGPDAATDSELSERLRMCWVQKQTADPDPAIQFVPMASVFFPALAATMINTPQPAPAPTDHQAASQLRAPDMEVNGWLRDAVQGAFDFTIAWMREEVQRLKRPEEWSPNESQHLRLPFQPGARFGSWVPFQWAAERTRWRDAFSSAGLGDIQDGGRRYIDLWRAATEIEGYICCVHSKRTKLRKLVEKVREKPPDSRRYHRSFLLIDSPGSGKTYLVKCLAKKLGMRLLTFNVTQMRSRDDLLACFDMIVTTQAENPDERILVFIDEINAKLHNSHLYDAFLAPLEEGVFIRAEKAFHIDPCVWVFAGTESPLAADAGSFHDRSEKGSDFVSRLTMPPIDLKINDKDPQEIDEASIEKIYVGVSLIRAEFKDVRRVSRKVLHAFKILPVNTSFRALARLVKSFRLIQYAEVAGECVPAESLLDLGVSSEAVNHWQESAWDEFVEIRSAPPEGDQPELPAATRAELPERAHAQVQGR
jgi:hypothetical protein